MVLLYPLALHTAHRPILTHGLSIDTHCGVDWVIRLTALVKLKYLGILVIVLVLLLRRSPLDDSDLTLMSLFIVIIHDFRRVLLAILFKGNVALASDAVLSLQTGSSGPVGQIGLLF